MKRCILVFLSLQIGMVLAQPISISGVTPGKTNVADLKDLLVDSHDLRDGENLVSLKELGKLAEIKIDNGVVYEVKLSLMSNRDVLSALTSKYGQPKKITGKVKSVKCQNGFGASFDGFEGSQTESWPMKDGVVASIEWAAAYKCAKFTVPTYFLKHIETSNRISSKLARDKASKENESTKKLKDSL